MNNSKKIFGALLRSIRISKDLSQKDLAEKSGIDPSHLNKIEKGINMPSDDVLFRLADILVAEELFIAAGRLVPPEFEKKYPLKEPLIFPEEEVPHILEKLFTFYETEFRKETHNYRKKEDEKRALEKIISSMEDVHRSSIENLKQLIEKESKNILPKITDYNSVIMNLLNSYDKLNRIQDDLGLLAMKKWFSGGKRYAVPEVWREIKLVISIEPTKFLQECFQIEEDDAVFIIDFIQLRKKRQNPPKDG